MIQQSQQIDSGIDDLMLADDWHDRHGSGLFPTKAAFVWFIRRNRDALIEADVYLPRKGRCGSLVSTRFGKVAREILRNAARRVSA